MKKQTKLIVAALAFALASFTTANAQFKKSDNFVEGTVSYTKTTDVDASYSVSPTLGHFVTNRFAVGAFGTFGKSAATKDQTIGVFGRCYFTDIKSIKLYSQASLASISETDNASGVKATNVNLGLGANYFITSKLALTMNVTDLISYTSVDSKSTLTVGFDGVANPFSTAKFGVLYKF